MFKYFQFKNYLLCNIKFINYLVIILDLIIIFHNLLCYTSIFKKKNINLLINNIFINNFTSYKFVYLIAYS